MALDVAELIAHEPHLVETVALQHLHDVSVFLATALAQFTHLTDDSHLRSHLHQVEVVERSLHRCRIGVVGIHDEVVCGGLGEL